ncbi:HAD family hydrolase [Catenisphaera adipataccumulans]|jgi:phosphoglycolate phosphatase|uniref:Phosphoglycolate phosphatase n=1 Tax=Catenisphaera adipataccumulans TaxID=700500 RepID=A0A7W8D024_9FIRM|nr:HAD family hydrolase [Catenisphaera adipataccumulans]MBB5183618.1 phosphoglycolate phosphatase [Catenisphaera adipataccumulans]
MKRIIWDWNGTLFDDVDLCFQCINRLLQAHELPPLDSLDAYRHVFRFPIEEYYKKAGFDFQKTPFSQLAAEYMADYQEKSYRCRLQGDALATMQTIRSRHIPQTILSASRKDYLMKQLDLFALQPYIDSIYGIRNIYAESKEYLAHEARRNFSEDELWFVGDSVHDAQVADSVKADCVLVSTGHQSKDILERTGKPVADSLMQAWEIIHETD